MTRSCVMKKDRYPCNAGKQSFSYYNINIIIPFYLSGMHDPCNAGKQSFSYYNINIIIPFYLSGMHEYVHH